MKQELTTLQDMHQAGLDIAKNLDATNIVTLSGDLGAGKTTLTKGILAYFGINPETVTSPTFSIMNIYNATEHTDVIKQIVHIDTYRLEVADELLEIGFDEYISDPETITIIEWPEKIEHILGSVENTVKKYTLEHIESGRILQEAT